MREVAGTQSSTTYIIQRQGTLAQCVELLPIFEVYTRDTGYEGGGCRRDSWWRKEAPETQLRATLEETSREDKMRRHRKSNTH